MPIHVAQASTLILGLLLAISLTACGGGEGRMVSPRSQAGERGHTLRGPVNGASIEATIPLPSSSNAVVDVNAVTNRVYVSGGPRFGFQAIRVIDGSTHTLIATIVGSGAHVNPLTNRIYAGQFDPSMIFVYNGTNNGLLNQIPVSGCAYEAVVDPSINRVYGAAQCGEGSDPVSIVDGAANRLLATVESGGVMGPIAVNPVTHTVYIGVTGIPKKIDPTTFAVSNAPFSGIVLAVDSTMNRLYAQAGAQTQMIDGSTEAILTRLPASGPTAVNPTRGRVYIADQASASVKVFAAADHALIGTLLLPAGSFPGALAVNTTTGKLSLIAHTSSGSNLLVMNDALGVTPTLLSIAVTPATLTIDVGRTRPFTATGTFSDGSARFLTGSGDISEVAWSSSHVSVATIDQTGLATGRSGGVTTITAAVGGISGSTTLAVTARDDAPPVILPTIIPPPNSHGWNNTDITVSWSVTAPSGIVSSHGCDPIVLASETDGILLTCSATNGAGLTSSAAVTIKLDKTPPEAYNQFDPATHDVVVFGWDALSGAPLGPFLPHSVVRVDDGDDDEGAESSEDAEPEEAERRTYQVQDLAGNTLVVVEDVKREGRELKARIASFQSNAGPVITPPPNKMAFEWALTKTGNLKELEQALRVGKGQDRQRVKAKFEAAKNQTAIDHTGPARFALSSPPERKVVRPGLILLRLAITNGTLAIQF